MGRAATISTRHGSSRPDTANRCGATRGRGDRRIGLAVGTSDKQLDEFRTLLDTTPVTGLEWARGELAVWLRRLDPSVRADGLAAPCQLLIDGMFEAAADEFTRLSMPYDAALALVDSGDADLARRGLDALDRLGAAAVAAKLRRDLRRAESQSCPRVGAPPPSPIPRA